MLLMSPVLYFQLCELEDVIVCLLEACNYTAHQRAAAQQVSHNSQGFNISYALGWGSVSGYLISVNRKVPKAFR